MVLKKVTPEEWNKMGLSSPSLTLNFGVPEKFSNIEEVYKKSQQNDMSAKIHFDELYKILENTLKELIICKENSKKSLLQETIETVVKKKLTKFNAQIGMSTYKNILLPTISILCENCFFHKEGDFLEIFTEEKRKELMSLIGNGLGSKWVFVSIFN